MVNRVLIRHKVVQIAYSQLLKKEDDIVSADKELLFSLNKSYELYHSLLLLMIELTRVQGQKLDAAKHKFVPTAEEINPNMRFVNNRLISQLENNIALQNYVESQKISWADESDLVRNLLDKIVTSELYINYMSSEVDTYENDKIFWKHILKQIIVPDEHLDEVLENKSLYWNYDMEIISTFLFKSLSQFDEKNKERQPLLSQFKEQDDLDFACNLLRRTLIDSNELRSLIEKHAKNWDIERIAFMDVVIMMVALSEIINFSSIPTNVSLNEYIEIAKMYSTNKSGNFINGILDSAVTQLKKDKKLTKA